MKDFFLRLLFSSTHNELDNRASKLYDSLMETTRLEQTILELRERIDHLSEELSRRPTSDMVDMLKKQIDHMALRYERRTIYAPAPMGYGPIPPPPDEDALERSPLAGLGGPSIMDRSKTIRDTITKGLSAERDRSNLYKYAIPETTANDPDSITPTTTADKAS